jgi:hypothetical protein
LSPGAGFVLNGIGGEYRRSPSFLLLTPEFRTAITEIDPRHVFPSYGARIGLRQARRGMNRDIVFTVVTRLELPGLRGGCAANH